MLQRLQALAGAEWCDRKDCWNRAVIYIYDGFLSSLTTIYILYFRVAFFYIMHFTIILEHTWCLSPALSGHPCGITLRGV